MGVRNNILNIIDKIIAEQSGEEIDKNEKIEGFMYPKNNELDNIVNSLKNIAPKISEEEEIIENKKEEAIDEMYGKSYS